MTNVFIEYSPALIEIYECRDKINPMVLSDIDYHIVWLMGEIGEDGERVEEMIHENDDLTWSRVANAKWD